MTRAGSAGSLSRTTEVVDELQRLLGGSTVGLEYGWHEDKGNSVVLAELLLSVLQVVAPHGWVMEISSTMWVPMFGK